MNKRRKVENRERANESTITIMQQNTTPVSTEFIWMLPSIEEVREDWVVTLNISKTGPVLRGDVSGNQADILLDSGAGPNVLSRENLHKLHPGVKIVEPVPYKLRGVTGNDLKPLGKIDLDVQLEGTIIRIPVIVVEDSCFQGDLLIGYQTMEKEDIAIMPAQGGALVKGQFIRFLVQKFTYEPEEEVQVVAERSVKKKTKHPSKLKRKARKNAKKNKTEELAEISPDVHTPDEPVSPETIAGFLTESTRLDSQSVSRVTLNLKGVQDGTEVLVIPETLKIKGVICESAVYTCQNEKVEIVLINALKKSRRLMIGTYIIDILILPLPIQVIELDQTPEPNSNINFIRSVQSNILS